MKSKGVFYGSWTFDWDFMFDEIWLYDFVTLCFGERAHVLTETIIEHSKVMAIVTAVMLSYCHGVVMHNIGPTMELVMVLKMIIISRINMALIQIMQKQKKKPSQ